jgi:hypothetical protein
MVMRMRGTSGNPKEVPDPYPVRKVGDRWEVQVWRDCGENEQDALAIAATPVLLHEYHNNLRSDLSFASDLERTGRALARHGVDDLVSRLFLWKAAEIKHRIANPPEVPMS